MDFHQDFADLCSLLNASHVEFLIVGGYAVAFHAAPRFTGDLDILIRPTRHDMETYGGVPSFFIGRQALVVNKQAAGRI